MAEIPKKSSEKDARAARLAAALKANLRKRKAQARQRARAVASEEPPPKEVRSGDGGEKEP